MSRKASEIYQEEKINCGESMIRAYNEERGVKVPIAMASGFGSGLGSGSVCGAVLAAGVLIGLETGRDSGEKKNITRPIVHELVKTVREKYGSELCKDLKANKVSCAEIMDFTYEEMKKLLAEANETA